MGKKVVTILWGTEKDVREQYEFPDADAMRWFLKGVHAGVGWLAYEILPEPNGEC